MLRSCLEVWMSSITDTRLLMKNSSTTVSITTHASVNFCLIVGMLPKHVFLTFCSVLIIFGTGTAKALCCARTQELAL